MNIAVYTVYVSDKEFGCLLYHSGINVCHLKFRVSLISPTVSRMFAHILGIFQSVFEDIYAVILNVHKFFP